MSELTAVPLHQFPALADAELARAFIGASRASATMRAYASDWHRFIAWCEKRGPASLPASPSAVALFLSGEAATGAKASTINRRAAAIGYMRELQRHPSPGAAPEVKDVLSGIRRTIGSRQVQKAPATADD